MNFGKNPEKGRTFQVIFEKHQNQRQNTKSDNSLWILYREKPSPRNLVNLFVRRIVWRIFVPLFTQLVEKYFW